MSYHLTFTRCWACMTGNCWPTTTPHTWLDADDIEHGRAQGWEIPADMSEQARRYPCACWCAGQRGPHVEPVIEEPGASS